MDRHFFSVFQNYSFGHALKELAIIITYGLVKEGRNMLETAIEEAIKSGQEEKVIELLDKKGISVNFKNEQGYPLIYQAALFGKDRIVKLLLERGASINSMSDKHPLIVHSVALTGDTKVMKLLVENGVDLSAMWPQLNRNVLHLAAQAGHVEMVKFLIDQPSIDRNAKDAKGLTALQLAYQNDRFGVIDCLRRSINNTPENDLLGEPLQLSYSHP